MVQISFFLPPHIHAAVKAECKTVGINASELVRRWVTDIILAKQGKGRS